MHQFTKRNSALLIAKEVSFMFWYDSCLVCVRACVRACVCVSLSLCVCVSVAVAVPAPVPVCACVLLLVQLS
jgi:hypothetical protein